METQIQELYTPLFLYVKKRVKSREDAEDLTQEIFYKLAKSDSDKIDNIKSWVYTIAKNTITDYYRKTSVHTEELENHAIEHQHIETNGVEELGRCIESYVDKLPEEYRDILRLSDLEAISQKEIAERLDMNYVTVRSKIQRGRKKLKEIFSDCCTVIQGSQSSILGYERNNGCVDECNAVGKC